LLEIALPHAVFAILDHLLTLPIWPSRPCRPAAEVGSLHPRWAFRHLIPVLYEPLNVSITSISHQDAQESSCSTLIKYVGHRSITFRPPARERTAQSPLSMTTWAPAMPCLAYLAVFTRVLAPAACSRLCTRLTHVMYTSHATRYPAQVISCHARSPQHIRTLCSRSLRIIR